MPKRKLVEAEDDFHIRKYEWNKIKVLLKEYDWDFSCFKPDDTLSGPLDDEQVNQLNDLTNHEFQSERELLKQSFIIGVDKLICFPLILASVCVWSRNNIIPEAILYYCNWDVQKSVYFYCKNLFVDYDRLYQFIYYSALHIMKTLLKRDNVLFILDQNNGKKLFYRMHTAKQFIALYYALLCSYFPNRHRLSMDERITLYSWTSTIYENYNFSEACNLYLNTVSYTYFTRLGEYQRWGECLLPPHTLPLIRDRQRRFIRAIREVPEEIKKKHNEVAPKVYFYII